MNDLFDYWWVAPTLQFRYRRVRLTCHFPARAAAEARAAAAMGGTRRGGAVAIATSPSPGSDSPGRAFHHRLLTAASSSMAASMTAWNDVFVGLAGSPGCGVAGAMSAFL